MQPHKDIYLHLDAAHLLNYNGLLNYARVTDMLVQILTSKYIKFLNHHCKLGQESN